MLHLSTSPSESRRGQTYIKLRASSLPKHRDRGDQRLAHPRRQRDERVLEERGVAHTLLVRAVAVLRRARELPRRRRDARLWRRAAARHRRLGRLLLLLRPSILQTAKQVLHVATASRLETLRASAERGA